MLQKQQEKYWEKKRRGNRMSGIMTNVNPLHKKNKRKLSWLNNGGEGDKEKYEVIRREYKKLVRKTKNLDGGQNKGNRSKKQKK